MPQPIDMQTELARMTMAEKAQDAATRASLAAQQRAQAEEEAVRSVKETQVGESAETQNEHIDEDGKRKNPFVKRRKKRTRIEDSEDRDATYGRDKKGSSSEDNDGAHLDVTI